MADGALFYLVGPSGSGKDSLITYARESLATQQNVVFAHRYITRPANAGGENHIALGDDEFQARMESGLFAMHWQSHGHCYAIGIELNQWLAKGCAVVINGSREYEVFARKKYPELHVVHIVVSAETMASRLKGRGREPDDVIERRIKHSEKYAHLAKSADVIINNDGPLECAGEQFANLLLASIGERCN